MKGKLVKGVRGELNTSHSEFDEEMKVLNRVEKYSFNFSPILPCYFLNRKPCSKDDSSVRISFGCE